MKKSKRRFNIISITLLISAVLALTYFFSDYLPKVGDHNSPANTYVSKYYIENALKDTASPNLVTAILADYRGFDTMFETCVLFISGVVVLMSLATKKKLQKDHPVEKEIGGVEHFGSLIFDVSFRFLIPIIAIYAAYVLMHGEVSLGGGFQAGALLASVYLIDRITPHSNLSIGVMKEENSMVMAASGALIYALTGVLTLLCGGNFLEYGVLPFGERGSASLHGIGIFMIECGVTVCVMSIIINILEVVLERTRFDD